jgi:NAD-dependent dihydropyrimidine dehydrogenase PreA subunit
MRKKPTTYVIAEPCLDVKDKRCVDECPVDAIYEGVRMLYIHPDECIECGACEMVCPVQPSTTKGKYPHRGATTPK